MHAARDPVTTRDPTESSVIRPVYRRTEARATPPGWETATLGDIAEIKNGATPSTRNSSYWDGPIPWCTPTDITDTAGKYLRTTGRSITVAGLTSCAAGLLPAGALLLCSRATIGEIRIAAFPVCTNQGFKSLVCNDGVCNEFLYYLIVTLKPQLIERATGSTFLEIGKRDVASIEVILPPSDEQRAIADALSNMDRLLEALEALIAKKRAFKQTAMQRLLTGQIHLPGFRGDWERKMLGNICTMLPTANNPRSDLSDRGEVGYIHYGDVHAHPHPVLNCANQDLPLVSESSIRNAVRIQNGDLVMVDASEDLIGVGKSVQVQGVAERAVVAGLHTILCRGKAGDWAPGFMAYLQFIPEFRSSLLRVASGTSVYAISRKQLADVVLPLPPPSEQEAIVAVLSDMDADVAALEQRLDKARAAKRGMMQQLLTGRIRLVEEPEAMARVTVAS